MTALAEIKAEVARRQLARTAVPLIGRQKHMMIEVGYSAEAAIIAETTDNRLPSHIDGLPVIRTAEFHGWAVVER